MVEGLLDERLRHQVEDEEVARRQTLQEHVGDVLDVGVGHVVGVGGVVDEGPRDGGGDDGGGGGDGVANVDECARNARVRNEMNFVCVC
ncbi:hypothetical protein ACS0TY_030171 [Phlomoides rotata]